MLVAAGLLTWMIFWMPREGEERCVERSRGARRPHSTPARPSARGRRLPRRAREGVETALFLFSSVEGANDLVSLVGAIIGAAAAVGLGYLFYRGSHRLNLKTFFTATSALLLVFAAYLLAMGLQRALPRQA
jgi:high-affinity iron transporter